MACNFVFDIIVTQFESPYVSNEELNNISVEVTLNNKVIKITSSRINVPEFEYGSSTEFVETPEKLRQRLESCGMPIIVKCSGQILGTAQISFPQDIIDNINEDMPELQHMDTCFIGKGSLVVGTLELICRLVMKCEAQPKMDVNSCLRDMDKSINQQDILFIMSDSQRNPYSALPALDSWQPDEDEYIKLDLGRYPDVEPTQFKHEEIFKYDLMRPTICEDLRKMATEYGEIIDSITQLASQKSTSRQTAGASKSPCGTPCCYPHSTATPSPIDLALSNLSSSQYSPYNYSSNMCAAAPPRAISSQPNYEVRLCPVCQNNMSWLPKYANCPKCGIKQIPIVKERKPRRMTADEILNDYLGKPPATLDDLCKLPSYESSKEKSSRSTCRCTCKNGKLCANCRLRKQYPDIMQPRSTDVQMPSEEDTDSDPEHYCLDTEKSTDYRPFLSRVFSELRHMYDIDLGKQPNEETCAQPEREKEKENEVAPVVQVRGVEKVAKPMAKKRAPPNIISGKSRKRKSNKSKTHRHCVKSKRPVARRHGWAWSSSKEARKYGWRPGAILKSIRKLMNFFLYGSTRSSTRRTCMDVLRSNEENECGPSVLNVTKKNGEITITLRPTNNSHVQMQPIVFKVVKSDLAVALSEIKTKLRAKGFSECSCRNSVMMCVCRDVVEKKYLERAIQSECRRRGMESCVDQLVMADSSDSEAEFDIDVNTPAGVAKPPSPRPSTVNFGMQTARKPVPEPKPFPIKYSPYCRFYNCAAGDRFANTAFGDFGEIVFEDGLFGYKEGGPHGVPPGAQPKNAAIWGPAPGGPMRGGRGVPGGKSFPGIPKAPRVISDPIPVRMTKRYYRAREIAAQEAKMAQAEMAKKKTAEMMKYMMSKGAKSKTQKSKARA
ncbi:uncharacterized protein LOC115564777 [Drosophila navojoa]|nr:uncharacterized protein LOC115564777 [Drosophila navojoa]